MAPSLVLVTHDPILEDDNDVSRDSAKNPSPTNEIVESQDDDDSMATPRIISPASVVTPGDSSLTAMLNPPPRGVKRAHPDYSTDPYPGTQTHRKLSEPSHSTRQGHANTYISAFPEISSIPSHSESSENIRVITPETTSVSTAPAAFTAQELGRTTPPEYEELGRTTPPRSTSAHFQQCRTENINSPNVVTRPHPSPSPFIEAEDDDLLPSTQGHEFVFQGNFGDVELGASFTAYHYACIKQQVPITRVQDVLCRSGILYLGLLSQTFRKFFGQDTVDQIVQCFTERYWPRDLDVKEDRLQVQEWFNFLEDEANLTEASDLILKAGSNPRNRKLWLYILNAMERLAQSQTSTNKSEATVMTRYVVPLLEVFLNKPRNNVILDTPNTIAKVVQHRKQLKDEKQGKRPDVRLSAVDINGDMVIEIGHGEIKSGKHDKGGAAVSRDLVRVGLFMKDQLDAADDTY
ncbi:hypothetical protein BGX21_004319, partial [Mortierella sp. AD011]